MSRLIQQLGWLLIICTLAFLPPQVMSQDKPNIVLVFMDNFGWGNRDLTVEGSLEAQRHHG